jgi:glycerophosphoryl diester phosphodiesterase
MPENSLQAFIKAIELGVHTLELDVAVSRDNVVVVSHEPYMNTDICLDPEGNAIPELDGKSYNLHQMTFEEIKKFDCGTKPYAKFPKQIKLKSYKPALDEVLKRAIKLKGDIKFNIEIKSEEGYYGVFSPQPREFVALVLEVINKNNAFNLTNLQSFDLQILEEIKLQAPKMPVALLIEDDEDILNKMSQMSYVPDIISPYHGLLNKEMVENLHAKDFKVIPWTVNTKLDMQNMITYKVDGIITDYPDVLVDLINN